MHYFSFRVSFLRNALCTDSCHMNMMFILCFQIFVTVLDRNDNAPDFSTIEYRASIVENSPAGTEVLRVTARDPDLGAYGQVTYK